MNHCQLISVNIMPAYKSHQRSRRTKKDQRGGNMFLRSDTTTQSKRKYSKRRGMPKQSKVKQHLLFLCTCFMSNGKQRKDMIARANKGQMEAIGEITLNLLKGNIVVPNSLFTRLKPHKAKLLYLTRKNQVLSRKSRS